MKKCLLFISFFGLILTSIPSYSQTNNLLAVQRDDLYEVNCKTGEYKLIPTNTKWLGTEAMTYVNGSVYIIGSSNLYKVNPASGSYAICGASGAWGSTSAMTTDGTNIFAVQKDDLYQVNPDNGVYQLIPTKTKWLGTEAMTYVNGSIYIIGSANLYKVNPVSGSYAICGAGGVWGSTSAMASDGLNIYAVQKDDLYEVNPKNGVYRLIPTNTKWLGTEAMTFADGTIYIFGSSNLYKVDPNSGSYAYLGKSGVWSSTAAASTSYAIPQYRRGPTLFDACFVDWWTHSAPKLHIFKGTKYSVFDKNAGTFEKDIEIANGYPGLPFKTIDACYVDTISYPTPQLYIFSGTKYARWDLKENKFKGVNDIARGYPGVPFLSFDACYIDYWSYSSPQVYIFSGKKYARFDTKTGKCEGINDVSKGFPSVPYQVFDDILLDNWTYPNPKIYIFNGIDYYMYDLKTNTRERIQSIGLFGEGEEAHFWPAIFYKFQ